MTSACVVLKPRASGSPRLVNLDRPFFCPDGVTLSSVQAHWTRSGSGEYAPEPFQPTAIIRCGVATLLKRDYPDHQKTFGHPCKSEGYEWGIGFVPPDVPLFTASTGGLQWTRREGAGAGVEREIPHPVARLMLWACPSRYPSQQSANPSHQEGCRDPASSRIRRRDRICYLRTVGYFRR